MEECLRVRSRGGLWVAGPATGGSGFGGGSGALWFQTKLVGGGGGLGGSVSRGGGEVGRGEEVGG